MKPARPSLEDRIRRAIRATGPMSLAEYMQLCLADPEDGYYAQGPAIGAAGDFVTAPEVSQMFGELVGIWCAAVWRAVGAPHRFTLAEAGPGHGTMMADLLRAGATVRGFAEAVDLVLIETSPAMIERQAAGLAQAPVRPSWVPSLDRLSGGPLILVANEFVDALPLRQFVRTATGWRERCVGLDDEGKLAWTLGIGLADGSILPQEAAEAPVGAVFEHAPARLAWLTQLAEQLRHRLGAALIIDYGYAHAGLGDTFQAVRGHDFADPLASPGKADLTAHVDFAALAKVAGEAGVRASPVVTQGEFLGAMGLAERAARLCHGKPPAVQRQIAAAAERLANPAEMGDLFKVMALADEQTFYRVGGIPPFA